MADIDWNRWAQALSEAPDAEPSPYFLIEPGSHATLDLIFSHTYIPPGKFNLKRDSIVSPNWRLYLNCSGNDYFQRGIPNIAASIGGVAGWLARVAQGLAVARVRALGVSMGGYAALLFGYLIGADHIIAVGPEIEIGRAHDRSFIWSESQIYDPHYRDLAPILKTIGDRARLVFPAYDVADFIHIARAQAANASPIIFLHAFHSGGQWLDWPKILSADGEVAMEDFTGHPWFDFNYACDALAEGQEAFRAICERRFAVAHRKLETLRVIKSNPGLTAQAAAQLALLGDDNGARDMLAHAKEQHRAAYQKTNIVPPDAFPARLVLGAYRHVLSEDEQKRLRQLFDRREAQPNRPQR